MVGVNRFQLEEEVPYRCCGSIRHSSRRRSSVFKHCARRDSKGASQRR